MKKNILLTLYISFFKISFFTLGGGAAMLPLMDNEFVSQKKLLTKKQFSDVLLLTSSLPGVIAFNAALLVGVTVAQTKGAVSAVLGVLTPPIIVISFLAPYITKLNEADFLLPAFTGLRAGIAALILLVLIHLGRSALKSKRELTLALVAFLLVRVFNIDTFIVIILCGALGWLSFYRERQR